MLVVTDIKVKEYPDEDGPVVRIMSPDPKKPPAPLPGEGSWPCDYAIETEVIKGRRFKIPSGADLMIGWCKKAHLTMGLPFEAFDKMSKGLSNYAVENKILETDILYLKRRKITVEAELYYLKNMPFWKRLIFLFTGVIR